MKIVKAQFKLIHKDAKVPIRRSENDAGYDIFSIENGTIWPKNEAHHISSDEKIVYSGYKVFRTGVRIAVPQGYFISVRGRSGLGFRGIRPFIGTLDPTYNGELLIMLYNFGLNPYTVNKGDRIAQVIIEEQIGMELMEVDEFSAEYNIRGHAGFGSSGR